MTTNNEVETTTETTEPAIEYLGNMQHLEIAPTDTIVIQTEQILDADQRKQLIEMMNDKFPTNKCIVLTGGLKLGVIHNDLPHESFGFPPQNIEYKAY